VVGTAVVVVVPVTVVVVVGATEVDVVEVGVDVEVVEDVDVVEVAPVVVVVLPAPNEMSATPLSPDASPYVSVQTSPFASCAGVGGQGYRAASAAAVFPALSFGQVVMTSDAAPPAGPTVPWVTWSVVETVPVELVVTS